MFGDLWSTVLNPLFLITIGLVSFPFLLLFYSVYRTWEDNKHYDREE